MADRDWPICPRARYDVLWGGDGKPPAVIEAKLTRKDARVGQQQANSTPIVWSGWMAPNPVLLSTNGYEHSILGQADVSAPGDLGFREKGWAGPPRPAQDDVETTRQSAGR